jgi:hypothetical protein
MKTDIHFLIISRSIILRMRNISDKLCRENQITKFVFSKLSLFVSKIVSFYEIIWKNIVQPDRPQKTIWRMRIACWIPKETNINSE